MGSSSSAFIIFILLFCIIIPQMKRRRFIAKKLLSKGNKAMLPENMTKEFIGKVCYVNVFEASMASYVRILDVESNWLKVKDDKGVISMINGDMVKSIQIAKEKYQTKCM